MQRHLRTVALVKKCQGHILYLSYKFATVLRSCHLTSSCFFHRFPRCIHTSRGSRTYSNNKEIILNHSFATLFITVSLFGVNLVNGPWCSKQVFGLIELSFLLSFCFRFAVTSINTQSNAKHMSCVHKSHASRASVT